MAINTLSNKLVVGAAVVAIIFVMIGHIYSEHVQKQLKVPILKLDEVVFDGWSALHFMLFAFFGFVKPGHPLTFFMLGAAFEVFEDGMASEKNTKFIHGISYGNDSYWYCKADDLFSNLIGYVIGQAMRTVHFANFGMLDI